MSDQEGRRPIRRALLSVYDKTGLVAAGSPPTVPPTEESNR